MLSVLLTVLNPALKPFYDAFYKVFLMVRSARINDASRKGKAPNP